MANSWAIDPSTRDYRISGGSPVQDATLVTPAYVRLKTRRTQWLYAPNPQYGSDYFRMHRRLPLKEVARLPDLASKALQPLIDDGRAASVTADVAQTVRGAATVNVKIIDAQGAPQEFKFNPIGV